MTINYTVAKAAMMLLANQGKQGHVAMVGISQADFDLLTGSVPWSPLDRGRVHVALNALLNASCDILQCPRFQLPAEYVASGIALFVNPINAQAACRIMERSPSAADLGKGGVNYDVCSAEQLFGLVVQLYGDQISNQARAQFETKTSLALESVIPEIDG